MTTMAFKLIMAFIDEDHTDKVLDASRRAGATGATIITNAQGQGLKKKIGIFGLEIMTPRDVILVLCEARRVDTVLKAVTHAGKLDESLGTGVAIVLDVEQAIGLKEHIAILEKQAPVAD